jgi:integrase-like protein
MSQKAAAAAFCVSPATTHRCGIEGWAGSSEELASGAWLFDRSSRRTRVRVCLIALSRSASASAGSEPDGDRGWSPEPPAARNRRSGTCCIGTVSRAPPGSRARRPAATNGRVPANLLHMDTARRVGYNFAHAIVDDHSRLAYVELLEDEKAATVTAFVERALAWFAEHDIAPRRLMTDNAFSYVRNRSLRELLADRGIKHIRTQAPPAQDQRQGRALPPNRGPRMGVRMSYRSHHHHDR